MTCALKKNSQQAASGITVHVAIGENWGAHDPHTLGEAPFPFFLEKHQDMINQHVYTKIHHLWMTIYLMYCPWGGGLPYETDGDARRLA